MATDPARLLREAAAEVAAIRWLLDGAAARLRRRPPRHARRHMTRRGKRMCQGLRNPPMWTEG